MSLENFSALYKELYSYIIRINPLNDRAKPYHWKNMKKIIKPFGCIHRSKIKICVIHSISFLRLEECIVTARLKIEAEMNIEKVFGI